MVFKEIQSCLERLLLDIGRGLLKNGHQALNKQETWWPSAPSIDSLALLLQHKIVGVCDQVLQCPFFWVSSIHFPPLNSLRPNMDSIVSGSWRKSKIPKTYCSISLNPLFPVLFKSCIMQPVFCSRRDNGCSSSWTISSNEARFPAEYKVLVE